MFPGVSCGGCYRSTGCQVCCCEPFIPCITVVRAVSAFLALSQALSQWVLDTIRDVPASNSVCVFHGQTFTVQLEGGGCPVW